MGLEKVYDKVYHLEFLTRGEMANSFKRFYGHYESPKFADKVFSEKKFDLWYSKETRPGMYGMPFTKIARGFNIPKNTFDSFFRGDFKEINEHEKKVLDLVSSITEDDYYVISTIKWDSENFLHELAHGMFYSNRDYSNEVLDYLKSIPDFNYSCLVHEMRKDNMTAEKVMDDEIHAQLLTDYYNFYRRGVMRMEVLEDYSSFVRSIFERYQ